MRKKIFIICNIFLILGTTINNVSANNIYNKGISKSPLLFGIIIRSIALGILGASAICAVIGIKHKPVKIAKNANEYVDKNTINITEAYDQLLESTIKKEPKYKK